MPTYNVIDDSEIEDGKPVTNQLVTKLRDNPIAIVEGNSDDVKIEEGAISTSGATAGDNIFLEINLNEIYDTNDVLTTLADYRVAVSGTYRFQIKRPQTNVPQLLQWKKGSTVIAEVEKTTTTTEGQETDTADYTLSAGDTVQFAWKIDTYFGSSVTIASISVSDKTSVARSFPVTKKI